MNHAAAFLWSVGQIAGRRLPGTQGPQSPLPGSGSPQGVIAWAVVGVVLLALVLWFVARHYRDRS